MAGANSAGGTRAYARRVVWAAILTAACTVAGNSLIIAKQAKAPVAVTEPAQAALWPAARSQSAAAQMAVAELQSSSLRTWNVRWSSRTGLPRSLAGGRSASYTGTARQCAQVFLAENAALFGIQVQEASVGDVWGTLRDQTLPNATKVTFEQRSDGVPVLDAIVGIIVNSNGQVVYVSSSVVELAPISTQPSLTSAEAVQAAIALYGPPETTKTNGPPRLVIVPSDPPRLAYEVNLTVTGVIAEPWQVIIDAADGSVLSRQRMVMDFGAARVFCPNPVVTTGNTALRDQSDADAAVPLTAYFNIQLDNLAPPVNGLYSLKGSHVWMKNFDIPTNVPPTSPNATFSFYRFDNGFEEVMAYYTIDRSQEYIQSLGYTNINNHPQEVDAHGLFGFDNSSFLRDSAGFGHIEYGDGGVDDAEDTDIILHEYGHAIHESSAPGIYFGRANNGYGNETGAMSEGFGDYWAASSGYDSSLARGFPPEYVGEWDAKGYSSGPAEYLRVVNSTKVYPADMADDKYADAEIWSGTLWDIFLDLGRERADRIVLYSHFLVPPVPDFADGAQALIDADALLYPVKSAPDGPIVGAHFNTLCAHVGARGLLTCSEICYCPELGNPQGGIGVDALDLGFIIDEAFNNGPSGTTDPLCQGISRSDLNCDTAVDLLDVSYAVDYLFTGGQAPCDPCAY